MQRQCVLNLRQHMACKENIELVFRTHFMSGSDNGGLILIVAKPRFPGDLDQDRAIRAEQLRGQAGI